MVVYDLLILGGGPAGYLGAERAAQQGFSVAVFEERSLGGVCLNEGCIPTKALLYSAKTYTQAKEGEVFGIKADKLTIDHQAVLARKDKVVKDLVSGVGSKLKKQKVEVIKARATIAGRGEEGFVVEADGQSFQGKRLLIATGSTTTIPPINGLIDSLDRGFTLTSREMLDEKELPKNLVIIGAGIIGVELAAYYNALGSKVTIIEMLDKIAGPTDNEISSLLQKLYTKKGIDFYLGAKVTTVKEGSVEYEQDGKKQVINCDRVLLASGRQPATADLGLETLQIATDKGAILTDERMRTNVANVWAAGDVNGKYMLAHTAYREAEVAISDMLGQKDVMRYDAIPAVIYTSPEVASVGETVESAQALGLEVYVKKLPMQYSGRYYAETDKQEGFCKLVFEQGSDRLLGAHLIGNYAAEIILGATAMVESHWPLESLQKLVFAHPTVGEIIRETFFTE